VRFRRYLHARHQDRIAPFQIIASKVEAQIDCTACANCCREMIVEVTPAEIRAIAMHLNLSVEDVRLKHTTADPGDSSQRVLRNARDACTFLDGNLCLIYDARPGACRRFRTRTPESIRWARASSRRAGTRRSARSCTTRWRSTSISRDTTSAEARRQLTWAVDQLRSS